MNYRFLSVILVTGLVIFVVIGFSVFNYEVESKSITGPVLSKEEAISRAMNNFRAADNPRVIEARLLRHGEALKAMGAWVNYDQPGFKYTKNTPVWVVAIAADNTQNLPMAAEGPTRYKGAIFIFTATDGEPVMDSYSPELNTDEYLKQVRVLPDLNRTMPISPAAPTTVVVAEPTATPAMSKP